MKTRVTIRVRKLEDSEWEATAGKPYNLEFCSHHEVLFGQGDTRKAALLDLDRLLGQACAEVGRRLEREKEAE